MRKLFWNLYAVCYDSIATLAPYQEMQLQIARECQCDGTADLLDAGCGSGNFLRLILGARLPRTVTAIDASAIMLGRARKKCARGNIRWLQADLDAPLPFADASFDLVVCANVLFALKSPKDALREFLRVLKPGGKLVLTTLQPGFNTDRILAAHMEKLRSFGEKIRFLPMLVPLMLAKLFNVIIKRNSRHKVYHFLTCSELEKLTATAGFTSVQIEPTYAGQAWIAIACKAGAGERQGRNAMHLAPSN